MTNEQKHFLWAVFEFLEMNWVSFCHMAEEFGITEQEAENLMEELKK